MPKHPRPSVRPITLDNDEGDQSVAGRGNSCRLFEWIQIEQTDTSKATFWPQSGRSEC